MKRIKKIFGVLLTTVMLVVPSIATFANGDGNSNSLNPIRSQDGILRYYNDNSGAEQLNADRDDPEFGDEREFVWLTDLKSGERVQELVVGQSYQLHVWIVNDGPEHDAVENITVEVGHHEAGRTITVHKDGTETYTAGQEYAVNAIIKYEMAGEKVINLRFPLIGHDDPQSEAYLKRIGKAKLYNTGGRLNGAQVNHAQLLLPLGDGILIGYDDQDGVLPYGKEYACEIRMNVRLVEKAVTDIVLPDNPPKQPEFPSDSEPILHSLEDDQPRVTSNEDYWDTRDAYTPNEGNKQLDDIESARF